MLKRIKTGFNYLKLFLICGIAVMTRDFMLSALCSCPIWGYNAGCPVHGFDHDEEVKS
jgi:hypothetical protein